MSTTAETTEIHEPDVFSVLGEALESAAETLGDVTASARDSARHAARTVSGAVSTGVYKGSYGASYGVVFSAVFLTELLPLGNALRRGLEDGANAGIDAATKRRIARVGAADDADHHADPATSSGSRPQGSLPAPAIDDGPLDGPLAVGLHAAPLSD